MKLAVDGGRPVRSHAFSAWPAYGQAERDGLIRALEQGQWWRVTGREVSALEQEFAAYHGCSDALMVTNGTHALELALLAADVGPGDEVIVPAYTFISTSMAVQRVGAEPVPVDVDAGTYCMRPESMAAALSDRTAAVIPVHAAGHVADMDALRAAAPGRELVWIQDAAHAHGSRLDGRRLGELDSIACFSFQNFKLMTAGEGGALLFRNGAERERAFLFANCGRAVTDRAYEHQVVGSNYRMNEFSAAVLRAQLERLPEQNERRQKHARLLRAALEDVSGIELQTWDPRCDAHPHYMVMFTVARDSGLDRNLFVEALVAEGIPAYRNYRPVYGTEAFWARRSPGPDAAELARRCPNAERIGVEGVWIHHRVLLGSESDVADVASAVRKVADGVRGRSSAR